jgi:hypothetical protein
MSYLTREMATKAVHDMKSFHDSLRGLYSDHGMNMLEDLGRRNILLSSAQEKYFADQLSTRYPKTLNDGRSGQPDIVIPEIDVELECKLTSRHKSGAISFQTDFETLNKKGSLDYLYVIAGRDFKEFAVLHFAGLTIQDFRPLSNGARGKVSMYKHKAMSKCNILLGGAISNNEINLKKLEGKLASLNGDSKSKKEKILKSIKYWSTQPTRYSFDLEAV